MVDPKQSKMIKPSTDLDYNLAMTEPAIGKDELNDNLQNTLIKPYFQYDEKGNIIKDQNGAPILKYKALWNQYGFFTRDIRLSNLSTGDWLGRKENDLKYCEYHINLASDLLSENFEELFYLIFERATARLELCQSKNGFLRTKMNTYRQENITQISEPPKKQLTGLRGT